MTYEQIKIGMLVYYVPKHAQGKLEHPDVEQGRVTGKNEEYIFVRFGTDAMSKACKAEQLA